MRTSYTAVVERNVDFAGDFASEPYETAWATEAIFFLRVLDAEGFTAPLELRAQISPDGMQWVDEGSVTRLQPGQPLAALRLGRFGGWLRLVGCLPDGVRLRVIVYLNLK